MKPLMLMHLGAESELNLTRLSLTDRETVGFQRMIHEHQPPKGQKFVIVADVAHKRRSI